MVGHVILDLSTAPFLPDDPHDLARKVTPPCIFDPIRNPGAHHEPAGLPAAPHRVPAMWWEGVQHVPDGTCRFAGNAMLPWTSRVLGLEWCGSDRDVLTEDFLVAHDADRPGEAPCGQGLAERFADAVPRISQHDPEGRALRQHTVEFFQCQVALGTVGVKVFRNTGFKAAFWIRCPPFGRNNRMLSGAKMRPSANVSVTSD